MSLRAERDHPRVCGEKPALILRITVLQGSPPRVRGKGRNHRDSRVAMRITPACAGKSDRSAAQQRAGRDHPRVCGEKALLGVVNVFTEGSPPRVRGKAASACLTSFQTGITPACAGKSTSDRAAASSLWDHPRVCGEKLLYLPARQGLKGSPPRVRGKVRPLLDTIRDNGITPACAGKSHSLIGSSASIWDHPRVCGEKTKKIP